MGAYGNVPVVELAEIAQFETKNEKEWDDFHLTELDVKNQKIYNDYVTWTRECPITKDKGNEVFIKKTKKEKVGLRSLQSILEGNWLIDEVINFVSRNIEYIFPQL